MSMYLISGAEVYAPKYLGKMDILTGGERILKIDKKIDPPAGLGVKIIKAEGKLLIPGIIDGHVHIAGAGGEGGPATRTPEMKLADMIRGGVTTVIGCLGTDGFTRSPESVLMKVKTLRILGVSAWMWTGAYQVPTPTFFGDPGKDLALIDEVIGTGEISISDHRSSMPTIDELLRLAEHTRVGSMLGGKSGIINFHLGDALDPFRPIHEMVKRSMLSYKQFLPTHCNRNQHIYEDARLYGREGWIDITTSSYPYFSDVEIKPSKAIAGFLESGVPIDHITMTSDANGSLPSFDEKGNLVKLEMGLPESIIKEIRDCVKLEILGLETVLRTVTSNPAKILKLARKGSVKEGYDADLVLIAPGSLEVETVMARGELFMENKVMLKKEFYA